MVHTVGISGINGNVGAPTTKLLIKAADEGKIKLVAFHREGSQPKDLTLGKNAEFRVLASDGPADKIEAAVKGVNTYISAVGFGGLAGDANVAQALAKSSDFVTFIPAVYSTTWEEADFKSPELGPILSFLHPGWDKAKELGLGVTPIFVGAYDFYWFEYGFVGSPIKGNAIWGNDVHLKNPFPITAMTHLHEAIARLATSPPESIKNKEYSVVTFWPTGQELLDLYTKLNGKQAEVKPFTKEDRDTLQADGANFGPAKVGYWDRWGVNGFRYEKDGRISDKQYNGPSLEEIARRFV